MATATLTINSKNYGAWSLRGWLMCKLAGLEIEEVVLSSDDPQTRAELLLLSSSFLVPRLEHDGVTVWDTLAIGEYLNERFPDAQLLPTEPIARAHCRSVSGEIHSGFSTLRSALPMHANARFPGFLVWSGAQGDIDRVVAIWHGCLGESGGPYLFGDNPTMADAMFAPVCSRFVTYDIALDEPCTNYVNTIMGMPAMKEWMTAAAAEPDDLEELDAEF